ncbi:MAG TPA: Rieske (2Fe-2S) protein [Cyclobacteriaceae bacterium]
MDIVSDNMINRRAFIKSSCVACASGLFLSEMMSSCAPALPTFKTAIEGKNISVPITYFETSNVAIVRDNMAEYDILVVKKSEELFDAIYMKCSHRENSLTATATGLHCSAHGSSFNLDGQVTKEPATSPLQKFPTEFDKATGIVSINIQSLKL